MCMYSSATRPPQCTALRTAAPAVAAPSHVSPSSDAAALACVPMNLSRLMLIRHIVASTGAKQARGKLSALQVGSRHNRLTARLIVVYQLLAAHAGV
jgi:hypothetical protein